MGGFDTRWTRTKGVLLEKNTYNVPPPAGDNAIITDNDGIAKLFKPDGTKVALGGGGADPGTLVTLGADTQNWDFATGLAGDTDGDYEIEGEITADATGRTFALQPNGSAPTFTGSLLFYGNGTSGQTNRTTMDIGHVGGDLVTHFRFRLQSKSGRVRYYSMESFDTTATPNVWRTSGIWTDNATVITSLRIQGSAAASIKAGSYVRWRKLGFTA